MRWRFASSQIPSKVSASFVEATEGLRRVIVGDGPLRAHIPEAVGFVPPAQLGACSASRHAPKG
jgi:hypothetical protein